MKAGWIVAVLVIAVLALVVVSWYISGLNKVVRLDKEVEKQWANVNAQLQRRNDLIPNLVETVRGYAKHEEGVFEEVARLRSQWAGAATKEDKMESARAMDAALSRLLLVVENYPQLRATENFQTLQAQLEGTENRIGVERMRYNEAARAFNTYTQEVFGSFFAKQRGKTKPAPYFEPTPGAEQAPQVKF
ncbi:MAG: LemA family protein [Candidatus Eisenbacteria bacterium]|nr:LemA family protein [Candidatus Eisenbacteria bacterium]